VPWCSARPRTPSAADAALVNGVAAHALDYDDMCFVSLAHPSCALVPAALAAAELIQASGRTVLDAYIVGFEIECRLGAIMIHATIMSGDGTARHQSERSARRRRRRACSARCASHGPCTRYRCVLGLRTQRNIGTMVKPLHAGMAARNA